MMDKRKWFSLLSACTLLANMVLLAGSIATAPAYAQRTRTFPETGKTVGGRFLQYWEQNGGLAQQGYPISEEMQEKSDTDGKTYTVQYFERAVFELHPENKAPNDVLLSLLGNFLYQQKYPDGAPGQTASTSNPRRFPETGKTLGGVFRQYWEKNGGLAQQGYPISDEFKEVSQTDGKTYTVQYFERAVFELHPENQPPYNVLLSLLGKFRFDNKGGGGGGGNVPPPSSAGFATPGWTSVVVSTNNIALFYNSANGYAVTTKLDSNGKLTTLQRYPDQQARNAAFTLGWTHIVAAPNNRLIFYNKSTGAAAISTISDTGLFPATTAGTRDAGWSYIAIDVETGDGMYYNETLGRLVTSRLLPDNTFTPNVVIGNNQAPTDYRWSQFVPVGQRIWFWYVQGNGNGITVRLNPDGSRTDLKQYTNFARDWTHFTRAGTSPNNSVRLYLYNKTAGSAATGFVLRDTGEYKSAKDFPPISREWSHFVPAPTGDVVIYSTTTGRVATDRVDDSGNAVALQRYEPTIR